MYIIYPIHHTFNIEQEMRLLMTVQVSWLRSSQTVYSLFLKQVKFTNPLDVHRPSSSASLKNKRLPDTWAHSGIYETGPSTMYVVATNIPPGFKTRLISATY
ncbi:nuclear poly(a) polymerase [Striga asiatica]|uniref:Nuclear poly(A) polymerase n=1 Tax=Striga asiatica TaxID=4170 RepID=A0A5A7P1M0_STRAF|nr:nuclear poly(a) polymerase [Striga asiatica]